MLPDTPNIETVVLDEDGNEFKHDSGVPTGFFAWEAGRLRWLSSVDGSMPCGVPSIFR